MDEHDAGRSERGASRAGPGVSRALAALREVEEEGIPTAFFAPGRIEIVGKHVDYAGGRSLVATVDRGISVAVVPTADRAIRFIDADRGVSDEVIPEHDVECGSGWPLYPRTLTRRLVRDWGALDGGAVVAFSSTLPRASGLSSSTALLTALWMALDERYGLAANDRIGATRDRITLARYLSAVEGGRPFDGVGPDGSDSRSDSGHAPAEGVGTEGGAQDHAAVLLCRPDTLTSFSYLPLELTREVPFPAGWTFVVGVSGVTAAKATGVRDAYNRLSREATEAARVVGQVHRGEYRHLGERLKELEAADLPPTEWFGTLESVLGDVRIPEAARRAGADTDAVVARVGQFMEECGDIVPSVMAAFDELEPPCHADPADALRRLGAAVDRSQTLAERVLRNQIPETVHLARSAREFGAAAASAFGAGFGGSVWALVRKEKASTFLTRWRRDYRTRFPGRASRSTFFVTRPGSGAGRLTGDGQP